jgi:hypothetical protein
MAYIPKERVTSSVPLPSLKALLHEEAQAQEEKEAEEEGKRRRNNVPCRFDDPTDIVKNAELCLLHWRQTN